MRGEHPIMRWISKPERRALMKKHGIKTDVQVYNIANLSSVNPPMLRDLVETAEANKMIFEKAKQLHNDNRN